MYAIIIRLVSNSILRYTLNADDELSAIAETVFKYSLELDAILSISVTEVLSYYEYGGTYYAISVDKKRRFLDIKNREVTEEKSCDSFFTGGN